MKDRLKALRKTLGLKQRELAERLECGVSLIGKWEAGQQAVPVYRIDQICSKFNVRREWLENGDGEMFNETKSPEQVEEELYRQAFETLYERLPEMFKKMFREIMAEKFNIRMEEDEEPAASEKKKPAKSKSKTQTNNGTVHGDMVQN